MTTTTKNNSTSKKEIKQPQDNRNTSPVKCESPVRITPTVSVKVRVKNVTDLMSLKHFLA